jgi:hypothetical protein
MIGIYFHVIPVKTYKAVYIQLFSGYLLPRSNIQKYEAVFIQLFSGYWWPHFTGKKTWSSIFPVILRLFVTSFYWWKNLKQYISSHSQVICDLILLAKNVKQYISSYSQVICDLILLVKQMNRYISGYSWHH